MSSNYGLSLGPILESVLALTLGPTGTDTPPGYIPTAARWGHGLAWLDGPFGAASVVPHSAGHPGFRQAAAASSVGWPWLGLKFCCLVTNAQARCSSLRATAHKATFVGLPAAFSRA